MNNARRSKLNKLHSKLEHMWVELEELKDEQENYIDSVPESLQSTDRYEGAVASWDCLSSAYDSIEKALMNIIEAIE